MKLVKEHINEKFTENSDPIKDMGIGELGEIQKDVSSVNLSQLSPNEMIILALNFSDREKFNDKNGKRDVIRAKLINYAIKNGANQIWYKKEELSIPYVIPYLYRITNAKYYEWDLKITYQCIWENFDEENFLNQKYTSKDFIQKFRPFTNKTQDMLNMCIKNIKSIKNAVDELK